MRVGICAGLALLLAGCGGQPAATGAKGGDASASREQPADARLSNPMAASGGSNDCGKNPDFAPVYAGGTLTVCSSAHFDDTGKDAGSFHYTTDAAPASVLAFSKAAAAKSGLTARISTDKMFSAGEGSKRTIAVFVRPEGSGSNVTVNWGKMP